MAQPGGELVPQTRGRLHGADPYVHAISLNGTLESCIFSNRYSIALNLASAVRITAQNQQVQLVIN